MEWFYFLLGFVAGFAGFASCVRRAKVKPDGRTAKLVSALT